MFSQMQVKNVNGSISGYPQTPHAEGQFQADTRIAEPPSWQRSQGLLPGRRQKIASRPSVGCQKGQKRGSVKRVKGVKSRLFSEYALRYRDQKGSIRQCHKHFIGRIYINASHPAMMSTYNRLQLPRWMPNRLNQLSQPSHYKCSMLGWYKLIILLERH